MPRPESNIRLRPGFKERLETTGLTFAAFADRAGVAQSTLHAWVNPGTQPGRKGGPAAPAAWRVANLYAEVKRITPDAAFDELFERTEQVVA